MSRDHDTTSSGDERDPVVARALGTLEVPDHRPGFWDDLEAALVRSGADDPQVGGSEAEDGTAADVVPLAPRPTTRDAAAVRTSRRRLLAVAAAGLALVGAVGLLTRGADEQRSGLDVADVPGEGTPTDPAPDGQASTPAAEQAAAVVDEWLTALARGDGDRARGLLAPASAPVTDDAAWDDLLSGLTEGAGAFAPGGAVQDRTAAVVSLSGSGRPDAHVVTVSGTVTREGVVEDAAHAVVTLATPDGPRISLDLGTTLSLEPAMDPFEVTVDSGTLVLVSVDGAAPVDLGTVDDGERDFPTVLVDVASLAGPGRHVVTVVAVRDGAVVARAQVVQAGEALVPGGEPGAGVVVEEDASPLLGAYRVRAAHVADDGGDRTCFTIETGDGVFAGPCVDADGGFAQAATSEGQGFLLGVVADPAASVVEVELDGDAVVPVLTEVPPTGVRAFGFALGGRVVAVRTLDVDGRVLTEIRP